MGTVRGKLRIGGRRTVNVGMARIRFDMCLWKNTRKSLVTSMMDIEAKNIVHSIATLVRLLIDVVVPKNRFVRGHRSCICPPEIKSPTKECWTKATK